MKLLIFGATGTIGKKAINLIKKTEGIELVGFSFYSNLSLAKKIKEEFGGDIFCFSEKEPEINNVDSYEELIKKSKADMILNAVIGFDGLELTLKALSCKTDIALANKESVVLAGNFIFKQAKKSNTKIYPVDSEHTALYSLINHQKKEIKKLYITASGGRYYHDDKNKLNPSFEEAVKHPVWKMGEKISIDSSTMINKFFEIIEAYYYFGVEDIEALYHPEVIVHSLIEFNDNCIFANMSTPDMTWSIQQALTEFKSEDDLIKPLNFKKMKLTFDEIDAKEWKPIKWANEFLKTKDKSIPIIVNCANDFCFKLFKDGEIEYKDIIPMIENCLKKFVKTEINEIDDIYFLNDRIQQYIKRMSDD